MIVAVVGFLTVVSLLTYVAARVADEGIRRTGIPTRWIWLAGIAAPFVLLLVPLFTFPGTAPAGAGAFGMTPVVELSPIVVGGSEPGIVGLLPGLLAGAWIVGSLGLAGLLIRTHLSLAAERRRWSSSTVSGRRVYVSVDRGPAVAGIVRPWIVLPRWALSLPERELDFVLLHEEEHLRARDTLLLALGLFFVVLAPWNPGSWLHLRRLKTAMEVDCDRRVLRRSPDRATYGESLLSVATRSSGFSLGLAAFTEKGRSLRTRILAMTQRPSRWTPLRSSALVLAALIIGVQACYVESPILIIDGGDDDAPPSTSVVEASSSASEGPTIPDPPPDVDVDADAAVRAPFRPTSEQRSTEELERGPTFTPFTVAPRIVNREEVVAAMEDEYPPLLRDAGIGGTVSVYFFLDEDGTVRDVRIDESSGHEALDRAALAVADVYRFTPALNRDRPVPVWVLFPITFAVR